METRTYPHYSIFKYVQIETLELRLQALAIRYNGGVQRRLKDEAVRFPSAQTPNTTASTVLYTNSTLNLSNEKRHRDC